MRRLRLWVSVTLVCLVLAACADPGTLRIEGTDAFKQHIQEALALIEEKSPDQYTEFRRLAKGISLVDEPLEPGIGAWANPMFCICISRAEYEFLVEAAKIDPRNLTYKLALTLAHETTHLDQMSRGDYENSERSEREALAAERLLLERLGIPNEDIERIAGDHRLESRHWEALK